MPNHAKPSWPNGRPNPVGIQTPGTPPTNYSSNRSSHITSSMDSKASARWTTFIQHQTGLPLRRTTAWLSGVINSLSGNFNRLKLLAVGAQHRAENLYTRVVNPPAGFKLEEVKNEWDLATGQKNQQVITVLAPLASGPYAGFFEIKPGGSYDNMRYDYEYWLTAAATQVTLEACYENYPIGSNPAQVEDGGPPPGDPSDLE